MVSAQVCTISFIPLLVSVNSKSKTVYTRISKVYKIVTLLSGEFCTINKV